ncbi:hypothetical protein Pla175_19590 [Pirellulimonas nuda]|uniref:Uncharacterized protein n=1 Tax=Pirellulimonas nuda TaxID=2528009 RepID=A0A518DAS2_9BACT|nr:hypothetical protein [Pirellulimonas nuda]QDU88580.1 hypothetical protein Pla175_19590 [Pirellulimonas nuda]
MTAKAANAEPDVRKIYLRPEDALSGLDASMRWEVTRRHPYYAEFWKVLNNDEHEGAKKSAQTDDPAGQSPEELREAAIQSAMSWGLTAVPRGQDDAERARALALRDRAIRMLHAIRVGRLAPNPAFEFDKLDDETPSTMFLFASVTPVTVRHYARVLLCVLPSKSVVELAILLWRAGADQAAIPGDTSRRDIQRQFALSLLEDRNDHWLDLVPSETIFHVDPRPSLRQILEDIEGQAKLLKGKYELPETRVHAAKQREYLKVWDACEGWSDGVYHPGTEKTFKQVAQANHESVSTVFSKYASGFKLVTGLDLKLELWLDIVARYKLSLVTDSSKFRKRGFRRNLIARSVLDVPESRLTKQSFDGVTPVFTEQSENCDPSTDMELDELIKGILASLGTDKSAEQIAEELGIDVSTVTRLRQRHGEIGEQLFSELEQV